MTHRAFVLLIWILAPGVAFGQTAVADSSEFPTDHPVVYVVDSGGQETSGRLQRADVSSLTIRAADAEMSFDLKDVQAVYRRGDSVWSGALIGGSIGAVISALLLSDRPCGALFTPRPCTFSETVGIFTYTSGIGAGIGIGIDALVRGRTRIYPFAGHRRAGVAVVAEW